MFHSPKKLPTAQEDKNTPTSEDSTPPGIYSNHRFGKEAEQQAARFLEGRGLRIIHRNFRCRGGEIDLIARHDSAWIFIEVRARSRTNYGGSAASVTPRKQQRLIHAARVFLAGLPAREQNADCRFDCVLFDHANLDAPEWLIDAFRPGD